jgi:DNA-binding transcriptional regulator GbsR (MarR family)
LSEIEEFDPEIKKIEDKIIQFLIKSPLFIGQKPTFSTIQAYFITRKDLNQKALKKLTGFSSGAISQELKELVNIRLIEKATKSSSGEISYSMKSVELAFLISYINSMKESTKWEDIYQKIKLELEGEREELKGLNGYDIIYQWINNFLNLMAFSKIVLKILEEEEKLLEMSKSNRI